MRESTRRLAVAGASAHQLTAVTEGVWKRRIGLAAIGGGAVDVVPIHHLGRAGGAQAQTYHGLALVPRIAHGEKTAVTGPHAKSLRGAGCHMRPCRRCRRTIIVARLGERQRGRMAARGKSTEQRRKEILSLRRRA